jgi:PAS domain S-box-containing protein
MPAVDSGLRRRAEDHLSTKTSETVLSRKDDETRRHLHELQVQRLELEMQNKELRQSRNETEKSLEKYTDLYEFAPVGYFTLDRKGVIIAVNLRGSSLVGIPRARLLGHNFGRLVADMYRHTYADFLGTVFRTQDKAACEVALQYKGNRQIYVLLEAMATTSGQECLLALIDLTERKQFEEQLRQNEYRYRTVVEDQTEIICRFKADGTLTFVNDVYCRFFGKTKDALLGNRWSPDAFPDDVTNIEEQLLTLSPSNSIVAIENRVYSAAGAIRWMHFINRGFFDIEGRLLEIQSVGRDITERKKAEENLRGYARRLIEMEEALRKKISAELHDEIGRDLSVLGMNLAIISNSLSD